MFLMFGLMLGGMAAVIPVVIHLLHRQKTTPIAWGAMQFLIESTLEQKRRKKIDHWLLMLLRMAVLLVLALMLARPLLLNSRYNPLATTSATDVAVVLDHSLAMGRRSGGGGGETLFEQGIGTLEKITEMMRQEDTLTVVLAEHTPRSMSALPMQRVADIVKVKQDLRQLKPGMTEASIPDAVLAARELVNKGRHARKLVVVISDEQRSAWQPDGDRAWRAALGDRVFGADKDVHVYDLPLTAKATTANVSVGAMNIAPGLLGVNRPVQIMATIANAGPGEMGAIPIELIVDGKPAATQQVSSLPAGQTQSVRFDYMFNEPGAHWIKVQADVMDALEADNAVLAAVNVLQKLPVLVIDGQLTETGGSRFKSSQFLQAAVQPVEETAAASTLVQPKVVSVTETGEGGAGGGVVLDDYMAVIVNDVPRLPPGMVGKLADYAQAGHGVWVILGPRTEPDFVNGELAKTALGLGQITTIKQAERKAGVVEGPGVEIKEPDNAMVALLVVAERNAFSGVALEKWWKFEPSGPQARVVLAATNGDPLVLARDVGRNGGRVTLWTTGVDGQWNNLPLVTNFVPLVNETIFHLSGGQTRELNRRLDAGGTLVWSGSAAPAVEGALLSPPEGGSKKLQPILVNGRYVLSYNDTYVPGLYELRFTPKQVPQPVYYSVNIDRRALDPTVLSARDIDWLKDQNYLKERLTIDTLPEAMGAENRGTELWPFAAWAIVAMLLWEAYLTRRMVKLQTGVDVLHAGLPGWTTKHEGTKAAKTTKVEERDLTGDGAERGGAI